MPTYEYSCAACQHEFELFQSFSDKPVKKCPKCGKNKVEKIISGGAGVIFKGGGFYETDYNRSEGSEYKKKADSECKATPETGGCGAAHCKANAEPKPEKSTTGEKKKKEKSKAAD